MARYVYDFDEPAEGGRELLGGKGIGLAEMTQLRVPVPAGFTITTDACRAYMASGGQLPEGLEEEIDEHLARLEQTTGKPFGDPNDPLLVSVRSGAAVSMPGMMDTILNVGLNDEAAEGGERFVLDSYRRLIQMYGEIVEGIDAHRFEEALDEDDLPATIERFKEIYREETSRDFPQDAKEQLGRAVRAVFDSWNTPRAKAYRRHNGIADDLGTAVNVVQMVFGNKGERSGTGVAFTRDSATGEQGLYGEFLLDAQGEDVVAGTRDPMPLEQMERQMPEAFQELLQTMAQLEQHYRDMQDIEFTVEDGKLYLLQTRTGKRTARASLRIALDLANEGVISREEAVARFEPSRLEQLLHPSLDPEAPVEVVATGLNASPGAAVGEVVFDADTAELRGKEGVDVVLVRPETTPDDYHGMIRAQGILTARGGLTSHAALVARGAGLPAVVGCEALAIDPNGGSAKLAGRELAEGDVITIDGTTGGVILGAAPLIVPDLENDEELRTLLGWADDVRRLKVRANAEVVEDVAQALEFGAEGIGLCRTEHMFRDEDRLDLMREMILAGDAEGRRSALERLLPIQQADFEAIFELMAGLPVTIRLLDWPLHEFLPSLDQTQDERLRSRIRALHEDNPMLGFRASRVGLMFPEIYEMQVRSIIRAAIAVRDRGGEPPLVEIMHPLVGFAEELRRLRELTVAVAEEEGEVEYLVGTMIELPRACVRADEIADVADFFSFGTNDLTQTALGISRDDAGRFLPSYVEQGILEADPFETLDQSGVGDLMAIAVERGRETKPEIKLGICGEHGGEPLSVAFCHRLGLDYVSCSPYRVPLARLAAAQAALSEAGVEAVSVGG
jgi:pyruvate, orthophosphate dikinase